MKLVLAVWTVKLTAFFTKLLRRGGTALPGRIGLKICPDLIRLLSAKVSRGIVMVCGTNGKTTTNNLSAAALQNAGYTVVGNMAGANMLSGVATCLALAAGPSGKLKADYACLEVDEAFAPLLLEHLQPTCMVVTNLFRDQLDRFGEIDTTVAYLQKAISLCSPATTLVLNGDDPLTAYLGKTTKLPGVYFGISENAGIALDETREGRFCKICGTELHYNYYLYGQLGDYTCPGCGFSRPSLTAAAYNISVRAGIAFDVEGQRFSTSYQGFYNIYNALATYLTLKTLGVSTQVFEKTLQDYVPQKGRMEQFVFNKPLVLNLSKNPIGFNQNISTLLRDERSKTLVVLINDNTPDGTDVSWLWDVDFERLHKANIGRIYVGGLRMFDMAVRFKYAGIASSNIDDLQKTLLAALADGSEVLYVLTNYTALFPAQKLIKRMEKEYKKGKLL